MNAIMVTPITLCAPMLLSKLIQFWVIELANVPEVSPRRRKRRILKAIIANANSETIHIMDVKFLKRSSIFINHLLEE